MTKGNEMNEIMKEGMRTEKMNGKEKKPEENLKRKKERRKWGEEKLRERLWEMRRKCGNEEENERGK